MRRLINIPKNNFNLWIIHQIIKRQTRQCNALYANIMTYLIEFINSSKKLGISRKKQVPMKKVDSNHRFKLWKLELQKVYTCSLWKSCIYNIEGGKGCVSYYKNQSEYLFKLFGYILNRYCMIIRGKNLLLVACQILCFV